MTEFLIGDLPLTFDDLRHILADRPRLVIADEAAERVTACRHYLDEKAITSRAPLYGITTGFGSLCNVTVSPDELTELQENLVMSHACCVGTPLDHDIIRLMLVLKAHALSMGHSGVQLATVQRILDFFNADIIPAVFDRGSLGASGDLAPLADLFLPLIGKGFVFDKDNNLLPAEEVLAANGWQPVTLMSKEGLALLNGTQFMSANVCYALLKVDRLSVLADKIACMSLEAFDGRIDPFEECIQQMRPHRGQIDTARNVRSILADSQLLRRPKVNVQDPYSFRCVPQVHGAVKDAFYYVSDVILTEINSVTDNPTIFPELDKIISGGNFHGEPIAIPMDYLAIALAELGNISERRVAQLIMGLRGLPEFLVAKPGLNSGFMIPQYVAASLVNQNKMYCYSVTSDSIVSSNGQEDHVSMGGNAATKLHKVIDNLERILAIELMNAAQALDFRHQIAEGQPAEGLGSLSSPEIEAFLADFRNVVPFITCDTVFYPLIDSATDFIRRAVAVDAPPVHK